MNHVSLHAPDSLRQVHLRAHIVLRRDFRRLSVFCRLKVFPVSNGFTLLFRADLLFLPRFCPYRFFFVPCYSAYTPLGIPFSASESLFVTNARQLRSPGIPTNFSKQPQYIVPYPFAKIYNKCFSIFYDIKFHKDVFSAHDSSISV